MFLSWNKFTNFLQQKQNKPLFYLQLEKILLSLLMFTRQNIVKINGEEQPLNVTGKDKRHADSLVNRFKRSLIGTGVKAEFTHTPDPLW